MILVIVMVIVPIQGILTTIANLENITYTILMGKYFNHRIKPTEVGGGGGGGGGGMVGRGGATGRGGDGRAGFESTGRSNDGGGGGVEKCVKKKIISAYVNKLCRVPVIWHSAQFFN
jgi:hypothetical protein